ncbi:MAG: deoxyribose-phosphate aldolase [Melioribacteraceae bacterium]
MATAHEIAKMIDHSLLHPTMTDEILKTECEVAKEYDVASVCIKPYAVKMAAEILKGTDVLVGTVIGFPQGGNTVAVKVYETEQAISDGAIEIDMVVNIGKVLSEDWDYIDEEIKAISEACNKSNAVLKVIFENDFLHEDKYKIKLCELCNKHKVGFVKTSTGYGFVKGDDGKYTYQGATDPDLILMRKYADDDIEVKAAGGVRTLEDTLHVRSLGVTRIGATATKLIVNDAKGIESKNNKGPDGY